MAISFFRRFAKRFFIAANVGVGLLYLLGCYAYFFNPTTFWYIGLLALSAIYLLVVLIGFVLFWLFAKKQLMLISIVAIACSWVPLQQLIKFKISSSFNVPKADSTLRIMSWNVEHFDILEHKIHPERKIEMLQLINKYSPDVACFQEMVGSNNDATAINYVPNIQSDLHFAYNYYSYEAKNNFDHKHHFGIITFSKYPIINSHTIETKSTDEYNYNGIFQYVDIVKMGDTVRVFNLHLQSLKFSKANLSYIQEVQQDKTVDVQASKNILAKLKIGFLKRQLQSQNIAIEIAKSPYAVVVCGDFNDVPNSYAYHTIGQNLQNTFAQKGTAIGRTFSGISPTLRIDNIFVSPQFEVLQYIRVKKKLSDHFPIIADVLMK